MATLEQTRQAFQKWDGYVEDPPGSNNTIFGRWYGLNPAAWCAMFLSYVLYHLGMPVPATTSKGFAWTPSGANYFKKLGKWIPQQEAQGRIEPGMMVFFYWPSKGRIAHVGWVDAVDPGGTTFWSWEANTDVSGGRTGGRVIRQHRSIATVGSGGGFGVLEYSESPVEPQPQPEPQPEPQPTPDFDQEVANLMDQLDLRNAHNSPVRGRHVDNMQGLLLAAGKGPAGLVGSNGKPDGVAGSRTRQYLGEFQDEQNTPGGRDYVCGNGTWKKLITF